MPVNIMSYVSTGDVAEVESEPLATNVDLG